MKEQTKKYMYMAATTAAEMIRTQTGGGGCPEDYLGKGASEEDLWDYEKACNRIAKHLEKYAEKYRT